MEGWIKLGGFILAAFASVFSLAKYSNSRELTRNKLQDEKVDTLFRTLNSEIQDVKKDVEDNSLEIKRTREQMHDEFVKSSEITSLRMEIREDFKSVFGLMNNMSEALNQLIGAINGNVKK